MRDSRRLAWLGAASLAAITLLTAACNALWGIDELSYEPGTPTGTGGSAGAAAGGGGQGGVDVPPVGEPLWSKRFGDDWAQVGRAVGVASTGDIYVAGEFAGSIDLGGGPLQTQGGIDIFLGKLDADGNHLWSRSFGGSQDQKITGLAVGELDSVVIVGFWEGAVDFGVGEMTATVEVDGYIAKFHASGASLWAIPFGGDGAQRANAVAADPTGFVTVVGNFEGTTNLGGSDLTATGLDEADIFVARVSPQGVHNWSARFGDTAQQLALGVALDPLHAALVTGQVRGTFDFGGTPLSGAADDDVFAAKFQTNGDHAWSARWGDTSNQAGRSVDADGAGNVYLTGSLQGTTDFGGDPLSSAGDADVFLVKLGSTGSHSYSHAFGDADNQVGVAVVGGAGAALLAGHFEGTIDFGLGALSSAGAADVFLAAFSASGEPTGCQQFGGPGSQQAAAMAVDGTEAAVLLGQLEGDMLVGAEHLVSAGITDVFLVKLAL